MRIPSSLTVAFALGYASLAQGAAPTTPPLQGALAAGSASTPALPAQPALEEVRGGQTLQTLAYRMQSEALHAVDLAGERAATREMYGINDPRTADFERKCLFTRRLIEKGVRFIQFYSGGGHLEQTWDGHSDCVANHRRHAAETDRPIAALIADLKRTELFEDTLLIWGGEFGRPPTSEGVGNQGRDHNWHGFSLWLAGAGVRQGAVHCGPRVIFREPPTPLDSAGKLS